MWVFGADRAALDSCRSFLQVVLQVVDLLGEDGPCQCSQVSVIAARQMAQRHGPIRAWSHASCEVQGVGTMLACLLAYIALFCLPGATLTS